MNLIDKKLSIKIKQVSFFLSFFVLVQHSVNAPGLSYDNYSTLPLNMTAAIQYFVGLQVVTITNPLFFLISGYLFFANIDVKSIWSKWKKRFYSLIVPYLIASVWASILAYIIFNLTGGNIFRIDPSYTNWGSLGEFINVTVKGSISYQLWFLRDLVIYIFLSPVLYFLLKHVPKITLISLILVWILNLQVNFLSTDNIIFFPLGAYLALHRYRLSTKTNKARLMIALTIWLAVMLLKLYLNFNPLGGPYILVLLHRIALLFGMYSIWNLFNYIKYSQRILSYTRFSFFVYLFHLPYIYAIEYLIDIFSRFLPGYYTINFILTPVITFISLVVIGKYLSKFTPKFYGVISGNR